MPTIKRLQTSQGNSRLFRCKILFCLKFILPNHALIDHVEAHNKERVCIPITTHFSSASQAVMSMRRVRGSTSDAFFTVVWKIDARENILTTQVTNTENAAGIICHPPEMLEWAINITDIRDENAINGQWLRWYMYMATTVTYAGLLGRTCAKCWTVPR